jgi:hypothetical protein
MPIEQLTERTAPESRAAKMLRDVFDSGRPLTYIRSSEEQRIARVLREVSQHLSSTPTPVWIWSLTEGIHRDAEIAQPGTESPRAALDFIGDYKGAAIFHLKDFHEPLRESAEIRRRLRDLYESCRDQRKFIVISSPVRSIPEEVERSLLYLELRPPDLVELVDFLRDELAQTSAPDATRDASDATLYQLARSLQGLTLDEARYALRRALAVSPHLGPESIPALLEEKRLLVNRSGTVEFIAEGGNMGEIGGLETLKTWLTERRKLFLMRDSLSADIAPKGLLMMGIPGCGKSLSV